VSPAADRSWRAALSRRPRRGLITLLTDFGLADAYVGAMKGVIACLAPGARVVDLTHDVRHGDVLAGGLRWAQAARFFPRGTVHVAVVDPGVGGPRAILAVRARGSVFLAPDNGLLGFVAPPEAVEEAVRVESRRFFLPEVSRTFHGRDIFAPVAARIAAGLPLGRLGPRVRSFLRQEVPAVREERRKGGWLLRGEIIDVDNFGNCITNIPGARGTFSEICVGRRRFGAPVESYSRRRPGEPLVTAGSAGYLEIAVNLGRADQALGLRRGQKVTAFAAGERSAQ